ncbi:glycosyltransferase family 2 protein [Xinfangfangia sp. CPCC 101601]|uniref:Glycosyltransferase family 2 protein n=1 Tax=Pseudogemmobacter lacusdianii TaxID=3069608 RepID=A0ABU0VXG6_9RHOB|nr:glycosyltransferase family 2 protein [Xinfangfangia sp. CPCC 101601]MDQ2066446.1 glycosyltransferase family 2 protein [Xinfangfangia sp. CPCC 101601]
MTAPQAKPSANAASRRAAAKQKPSEAGTWGVVSTVKAPAEQIAAFVAYHLNLGAAQIWLYFDDPKDPALPRFANLPLVTATPCDEAHWQHLKGRPDRHQNRQAKNARAAYRDCHLAWLAHIDVDEFLHRARPESETISDILASLPPEQATLRVEPFEAMHEPSLPDDIFTARQFRGALKPRHAHLRGPVLGPYAQILPQAHLSHSNGKSFFRTGVAGLQLRLHSAFFKGERLAAPPFDRRLQLLHFHAQDRAAWLAALPFRLTRGAYQYHPELQAHLQAASPEGIVSFYDHTQRLTPELAALLAEEGRLIEGRLNLRAAVAALPGFDADPK